MVEILQKDNKSLRCKAEPVPINSIGSSKIKAIIKNMKEAMHSQSDAVAIAAPQIGAPFRIFAVAGKVFLKIKKGEDLKNVVIPKDQIFINPRITKLSKAARFAEEGCLSVRYLYGKVKRSVKATVEAYNEKGEKITRGASGILAQIFQHEVEHLDGKLFIDKAVEVVSLPPDK